METRITLEMLPQPCETTCGPTCLHAVYRFYGDDIPLPQVVAEVESLEGGGTLDVLLACHALRRGYRATIYTYNLEVFDPTWFRGPATDLAAKLQAQGKAKKNKKLLVATRAYLEYLVLGGQLRFKDLTTALLRTYLKQGKPILCGLSATYLYRCARELGPTLDYDDVRGEPTGHFVVLSGYDMVQRTVLVTDPLLHNPMEKGHYYEVGIDRLICSILLGVLTYDANLLILEPQDATLSDPSVRFD
ncbi:MAG: C39 family peptidase [Desulfobacteraceae bacterium]|nr:C39 family peptidase [Desulfobacteraceae bacterium]